MELEFKRDFAETQERWDMFWKGRNKHPLIGAVLPKPGVEPVDKPEYGAGSDGRFEPVVDQVIRWAETHEFLGDAIPFYYLEFAADHFSSLLGADLKFPDDGLLGGWPVHFVEDWDDEEIKFRPESKWWEMTVKFAKALRHRCDGRLMIASPTLVANLDALVALRGAEDLLMDMALKPEAVHRALDQVTRAHGDILDAFAELFDYSTYGSISRHGMYSRGRINVPQCDVSCMISPDMFQEFVVPYLRQEMDHFDAMEYHLDGPGAIKHLQAICEIEKLDIVQWVCGAGEPSTCDWTWLYEKIDSLGKGQIFWSTYENVLRLSKQIKSRKLLFYLDTSSRQEIEDLTKDE